MEIFKQRDRVIEIPPVVGMTYFCHSERSFCGAKNLPEPKEIPSCRRNDILSSFSAQLLRSEESPVLQRDSSCRRNDNQFP